MIKQDRTPVCRDACGAAEARTQRQVAWTWSISEATGRQSPWYPWRQTDAEMGWEVIATALFLFYIV